MLWWRMFLERECSLVYSFPDEVACVGGSGIHGISEQMLDADESLLGLDYSENTLPRRHRHNDMALDSYPL